MDEFVAPSEQITWVFRNEKGMLALVVDPAGAMLPLAEGPWTLVKAATLTSTSEDERHALALIEEHGYCCFDEFPDGGTE